MALSGNEILVPSQHTRQRTFGDHEWVNMSDLEKQRAHNITKAEINGMKVPIWIFMMDVCKASIKMGATRQWNITMSSPYLQRSLK